ncbi:hypothetical protein [Rheinheimera baltica]|uniref:hypothetical protein n=1 Tax=Rheinheimera baltica TaxID=67576 RepID=UPI00273E0A54|nr:hypothetical protein [Rheinheimera baltica]MDP5149524.1 hypothetical protein [Rheinheimera baltica]
MKKSIILLIAGLLSGAAQAAVSGYPVVLVHGFQPDNLASRPTGNQVITNGAEYWAQYWRDRADVRIDWPSQERVAGKIASDYVWPKLQQMSRNGTCASGCIFVSHSTGDLVTRYIIDNQALWLQNAGLQPLNIVASFDFAGAGGGVELADLAVNVASGGGLIDGALRLAISLWLGQIPSPSNIGVLNDLRVNSARQLAAFPDDRVPRLRFVGAGSDFLGATGGFLPGEDDGVVASHSSCGASSVASFNSCSRSVAMDGKLASVSGPSSFMPYHYPMLMSEGYSHSDMINNSAKDEITAANSRGSYLNGDTLQFNTYDEKRGWWIFSSRYRVVSNSNNTSMSALVYQAAN